MDITAFNEAQAAYAAGDYAKALAGFSVCTKDLENLSPEEAAKFYHLIGNCYIKSNKPNKASDFYAKALEICAEGRKPSLYVNLGTALLAAGRNEEAAAAFEGALAYDEYPTPYKAQSGLGSAHLKLGNMTEAGVAYRAAALDPANPQPAKALVNLGVCFMELGRAEDAITSYETAIDLGLTAQAESKAYANLAQAYMTQGRISDAIAAFEAAEADGQFELSSIARHDLDIARLLQKRFGDTLAGTAFDPNAGKEEEPEPEEEPEEELEGDGIDQAASTTAFDAVAPAGEMSWAGTEFDYDSEYDEDEEPLPSPEATAFFDVSEDQINFEATGRRKPKRHRGLKIFIVLLIIIIIAAAALGVAGYMLGYGYPTQEQVAKDFTTALAQESDTSQYWSDSVDSATRSADEGLMANVVSSDVDAVVRSTDRTLVYTTAELSGGGTMQYEIVMSRKGLSWVIDDISLYFPSEH